MKSTNLNATVAPNDLPVLRKDSRTSPIASDMVPHHANVRFLYARKHSSPSEIAHQPLQLFKKTLVNAVWFVVHSASEFYSYSFIVAVVVVDGPYEPPRAFGVPRRITAGFLSAGASQLTYISAEPSTASLDPEREHEFVSDSGLQCSASSISAASTAST